MFVLSLQPAGSLSYKPSYKLSAYSIWFNKTHLILRTNVMDINKGNWWGWVAEIAETEDKRKFYLVGEGKNVSSANIRGYL